MQRLRQICAIVLGVTSTLGAATDEDIFKEKLQPVLAKNCAGCHTGANAQAGLSVDSLQGLTKGGKRGPAIHPGSGKTSPLVQFARGEQNPRMPVGGKPLDPATIDAIAAAIDSMTPVAVEASADDHEKWLYSAPSRPQVPAAKAGDWVRNRSTHSYSPDSRRRASSRLHRRPNARCCAESTSTHWLAPDC
jgi:mono/diheme cytochrome c family protein